MNEKAITQGFDISDKSACIVGCGGLGCNIAVHLVGAGIGGLILCDFDTVSSSNLNRQFLYTKDDIGKSKCQQIKARLSEYSCDTKLVSEERKIQLCEDMSFAEDCDIIILAVDNTEARNAVSEFSVKSGIPLVTGGINGFYGMSYLYLPGITPCPQCAGMSCDGEINHSISATAGIIGSLEAGLCLDLLINGGRDCAGKLFIYDRNNLTTLEIKGSESCKICN